MTTAEIAQDYRHNIGLDFSMSDALDAEYLDTDEVEDVDERAERQRVNLAMAEWFKR